MAEGRSEHTVHTLLHLPCHWQVGSVILGIVLIMRQSNFPRVLGSLESIQPPKRVVIYTNLIKQAWILILSPFTSSLFFPSSLSPSLIVWDGTGQRSQSITLGYMIPINQWEPLVLYYLVMISGGGEVLKPPKSWVPAIQSYKHLTGKEDGVRIPIRSPSQSVLSHSTRRRERNQGSLQPSIWCLSVPGPLQRTSFTRLTKTVSYNQCKYLVMLTRNSCSNPLWDWWVPDGLKSVSQPSFVS